MKAKQKVYGFGFIPSEGDRHFYVVIPIEKEKPVQIYECYLWDDENKSRIHSCDILKLEVPRLVWSKVADALSEEFGRQLKDDGIKSGKFTAGGIPVRWELGKEMMVLLWALERCIIHIVPKAISNWRGFSPEERRYLFTMTNAATGSIGDKHGWRAALRHIMCENPTHWKE